MGDLPFSEKGGGVDWEWEKGEIVRRNREEKREEGEHVIRLEKLINDN